MPALAVAGCSVGHGTHRSKSNGRPALPCLHGSLKTKILGSMLHSLCHGISRSTASMHQDSVDRVCNRGIVIGGGGPVVPRSTRLDLSVRANLG